MTPLPRKERLARRNHTHGLHRQNPSLDCLLGPIMKWKGTAIFSSLHITRGDGDGSKDFGAIPDIPQCHRQKLSYSKPSVRSYDYEGSVAQGVPPSTGIHDAVQFLITPGSATGVLHIPEIALRAKGSLLSKWYISPEPEEERYSAIFASGISVLAPHFHAATGAPSRPLLWHP